MRLHRGLIWLAVATCGCTNLLNADCGPMHRSTVLSGVVFDSTRATIGHVVLTLTEAVDDKDNPPRAFDADFDGPLDWSAGPLLGHLVGARLVKTDGQTVRAIDVAPGTTGRFALAAPLTVTDPQAFETLRQQFLSGQVVAELSTDLLGQPTIQVPLTLAATGWYHPRCPY